jgi:hypothetical protein
MEQPNKENIRLWVDALRSGEYEQAKRALTVVEDDGKQKDCCLGVACKVAIKNGVSLALTRIREKGEDKPALTAYNGHVDVMPTPVWHNWLGVHCSNPEIDFGEGMWLKDHEWPSLATFNDYGFSFNQIADIIEWAYL